MIAATSHIQYGSSRPPRPEGFPLRDAMNVNISIWLETWIISFLIMD